MDEAVTAQTRVSKGAVRSVVLAVEYKPKDLTAFHLSEVLLQAFYLREQFAHDTLHCLTDKITITVWLEAIHSL